MGFAYRLMHSAMASYEHGAELQSLPSRMRYEHKYVLHAQGLSMACNASSCR
jgi:hypothetical protein